MYFDWTYVILVLPALLLALWARSNVSSTFNKYSQVSNSRGITGAEAARRVLDANGLYNVQILTVDGDLTDHFDPEENVIRLSSSVYGSSSVAAVGVACHEAGHAVQHAQNYLPVKIRTAIVPVTNFGSKLSMPLIIGGLFLASLAPGLIALSYAGLICFGLCAVFQIVTLPTEFNASNRALRTIEEMDILCVDELGGAKKVLRAAALTYVAALAVTLMQLLRFILIVSSRRRK